MDWMAAWGKMPNEGEKYKKKKNGKGKGNLGKLHQKRVKTL